MINIYEKERKKIKQIIIRSLENGATKARACAGANIGRATFYRWMERSKSFKRDIEVTIESCIGMVEDAL